MTTSGLMDLCVAAVDDIDLMKARNGGFLKPSPRYPINRKPQMMSSKKGDIKAMDDTDTIEDINLTNPTFYSWRLLGCLIYKLCYIIYF